MQRDNTPRQTAFFDFLFPRRDESQAEREMGQSRLDYTSSYTTGPPPRGRKIHPFFRRSIPGQPTLPPPFVSAPVRSTSPLPVASSSRLFFVALPLDERGSSRSHPRLRQKVSLLRRFLPRWRHARRQESTLFLIRPSLPSRAYTYVNYPFPPSFLLFPCLRDTVYRISFSIFRYS